MKLPICLASEVHALFFTRAIKGMGTTRAGIKLVPVASELTLPAVLPVSMSQIVAS